MNDASVEVGETKSIGGKNNADGKNSDEPTAPLKSLISVIVPIYNVEKYVRKCLDSLVNQTMKQIEVIAIDDGSTDKSGKIADEYENMDGWPVIRVIHTENRGLSAARNRGIDEARSEWLMFVDSDDWVEPEFCRIPYEAAARENADLVIFQADLIENGKKKKKQRKRQNGPVGMINEKTAHAYGGAVVWNKLYRKELFVSIRYPEGRVFEDIAMTHKVVHKATKIVLLQDSLYNNLKRLNSISHTKSITYVRDCAVSLRERFEDFIEYGFPDEITMDNERMCTYALEYLSRTEPCNNEIYMKAGRIVDSLQKTPKHLSCKKKIALFIYRKNKQLFHLICRMTGRRMIN